LKGHPFAFQLLVDTEVTRLDKAIEFSLDWKKTGLVDTLGQRPADALSRSKIDVLAGCTFGEAIGADDLLMTEFG
jgi:hypothetical protein